MGSPASCLPYRALLACGGGWGYRVQIHSREERAQSSAAPLGEPQGPEKVVRVVLGGSSILGGSCVGLGWRAAWLAGELGRTPPGIHLGLRAAGLPVTKPTSHALSGSSPLSFTTKQEFHLFPGFAFICSPARKYTVPWGSSILDTAPFSSNLLLGAGMTTETLPED
ncbi:uncharacterized protein LOC131199224 isoform X2 [Ahaetulla prasina]|uniref:uncharacterized protein LOC131199224 isoform X2 n=1 Tax=Ahaetulla prasina TaxID=499056 RepID=UPI002649F3C2|nr:uncharacterized protein LOC131199224 isoform X2 [Ahaetulla prasina]